MCLNAGGAGQSWSAVAGVIRVTWSETELRDLLAEYLPTLPRHPSAEEFMGAPAPSRQAAAKAISATTAPPPMSTRTGVSTAPGHSPALEQEVTH
jgi:hypothetical protein